MTVELSQLGQLSEGLSIGMAAIGAAVGIGMATRGLMDAISRQPEIAGNAIMCFMIGAALEEACDIFAFVIAMKLSGMIG